MVAMQLSHDPLVRQIVRQAYFERAKLNVKPTKKGMKVRYPLKESFGVSNQLEPVVQNFISLTSSLRPQLVQ